MTGKKWINKGLLTLALVAVVAILAQGHRSCRITKNADTEVISITEMIFWRIVAS
jgi:hypothetical protein